MSSKTQKPSLLSIPPELRSRIYDYALVGRDLSDFNVLKNRKQPGLLSTCRQLRQEAITRYYSDNRFTVVVCNYNHTRATAFAQLLQKYHNGNWECSFQLQRCSGSHECAVSTLSLASWLEAYHKQPKCVPALNWHDTSGSERSSHTLTRHTFGVVRKLRSKPWPKVLEVLRAYFVAIELLSCDEASDDEEDEDLYPDDDEISDIDSDIDEASNDNDEDDDSEEGNAESDDSGDSGLETSDSEDD